MLQGLSPLPLGERKAGSEQKASGKRCFLNMHPSIPLKQIRGEDAAQMLALKTHGPATIHPANKLPFFGLGQSALALCYLPTKKF